MHTAILLLFDTEYQCITSDAGSNYESDLTARGFDIPTDPGVVDVGDDLVYTCQTDKYRRDDYTLQTMEVPCASDFTFTYVSSIECHKLCSNAPPNPTGVTYTPPTMDNTHGYWQGTQVT